MYTARARRVKRDSVDNLYRQCAITGTCPPDVKNKVEGNTLADKLLKIFSSILFFGGLGIGTGRGSGGTLGYRPIAPTTPRILPEGSIIRPTPPIDPIGPPDIIPIDALDPAGSAIVPLQEAGGLPESGVVEEIPLVELGETTVQSESDPISDVSQPESNPTIITNVDDSVAILDITTSGPPPKRIALEGRVQPTHQTHISVLSSDSTTNISDINVFVDAHFQGDVIGGQYEEIPLEEFSTQLEFEIEEPVQKTSTPLQSLRDTFQRARDLYGRRVQQIRTRNPEFLSRPSRQVQFTFENPAFEDSVSLEFEQDLENVQAAPDSDFQDVRRLARARLNSIDGHVRVSRLGQRGTIRTRSGLVIGQDVHFYYDISTIDELDAIELRPLGEHSGDNSIVHGLAESSFIDALENNDIDIENILFDEQVEDFSNSHVILTGSSRRNTYSLPTIPPGVGLRVFVEDVGSGLFVSYPKNHIPEETIFAETPSSPLEPTIIVDFLSDTYFLHPALYKRGKKRKRSIFV